MKPTLPIALLVAALAACSTDGATVSADAGAPDAVEAPRAAEVPDKVAHRLNRAEYDNTVRDLFGTSLTPAEDFPSDDLGHGFDNMADVLTLSPLHIELYAQAARALVAEAMADEAGRSRLLVCEPGASEPLDAQLDCLRRILSEFLPRAWRRPVADSDLEAVLAVGRMVLEGGDGFELAVSIAVEAALTSPRFVFRIEPRPTVDVDGAIPWLDDYALASRLSYFLWSSMPDDALLEAAAAGALQDPAEIERQVRRMLDDPKAQALVENFAGQWLFIRNIETAAPDVWTYPEFSEELRASMREEMERFFASFIDEDRSMLELLTADDTFVDPMLAAHYGLDEFEGGFTGDGFERVYLEGVARGGLLGQAGLLTALSYPTRTSPVRRGKFILGQLLCQEPPPPPAGVEGLPEGEGTEDMSLREQMAIHSTDPSCASCHATMDPLGFGLEHYDGVGRWRDVYGNGDPVDATGELPDGRSFDGAAEMGALIAADPAFTRCITIKLFTYAMGRPNGRLDRDALRSIEATFAESGYRFADLAVAIATSVPFRSRAALSEATE